MVDAKAEDDDDEGFGDFTFASSFPTSDQINGPKPTTLSDDDWGDFVKSPLRSKPSEPSGFSTTKSRWVKPRGALPLSLFGDVEEESGAVGPPNGLESNVIEKDPILKNLMSPQIGSVSGVSLNVDLFAGGNDVMSQQIKAVSGLDSDSNGSGPNAIEKDSILKNGTSSLGMDSILNLFAGNNVIHSPQVDTVSGISQNMGLISGSNNDLQSPHISSVSGLSQSMGLFSGIYNDIQSTQISSVSELSQDMGLFSGSNINNHMSQQIKAASRLSSDSNGSDRNVIEKDSILNGASSPGTDSVSGLFAGQNVTQSPQVCTASGVGQDMDLFSGSNNLQGEQIKAVNGLKVSLDLFGGQQIKVASGSNFYSSGMNLNADLFSGNISFDAITNGYGQGQLNNFETSNGFSNLSASSPITMGMDSYSDRIGGSEEFDDDGWEFKDAYSEPKAGIGSDKVDWENEGNFGVTGLSFEFGKGSHGSDLFSSSNGFSIQPGEVDIGFDCKPLTVTQNGFTSDSFFKSEHNGTENGLNFDHVPGIVESDESFGDFEGAFTQTGLNQERDETVSDNHKGALPLSIFGDEELETDDAPKVQDAFAFKPSYPRNTIYSQGSNISINDLISNLYCKAEQIPPANNTGQHTQNGLYSSDDVMDLILVNSDDDFEDASWDFKDASIQSSTVEQTSLQAQGDTCVNFTTNLKMINFGDFYCKLKDELSVVCKGHLDNLMRAKHAAALSGDDAKAAAIDKEIKDACKELHEENIYSEECSEDELPRAVSLKEFIEVSKLKFKVLESEYGLSGRLHLAEQDLGSAVELMKHATSMLDVLTVGSTEDQGIYISTWSKMISVCAQELKHGTWIWKQIVEKTIQCEILTEAREVEALPWEEMAEALDAYAVCHSIYGKGFILALGEIYRVVAVLGASTKLYKPWILASSIDSTSIYAHLEECYTLWSASGIKEALQDLSDPIDLEYHSTVKALLESIRFIHGHDELTLGNRILNQQVSACRLSLLTSEEVPDVKMVSWNGKYCFLPLANLWANLISCVPPELPYLGFGS